MFASFPKTLARDPRHDPRPGDVVVKGTCASTLTREVTYRHLDTVTYVVKRETGGRTFSCSVKSWREWCADCTVEKAGLS